MWRKRGRPKNLSKYINKITPELQKKKSIAIEVLDMCLKQNIIDIFQHSSGIKLRWFYTIMFGAPTIQSRFTTLEFHESKHSDEKFLQFVGKQYYNVLKKLKEVNAHKIVLNICIYNELPKFLYKNHNNYYNQKEKFIQGMVLLNKEFDSKKCDGKN